MSENNMLCGFCMEGTLERHIGKHEHTYKNHTVYIDGYITHRCLSCGESIVLPGENADAEKVILNFHRNVDRLLTPDEIRRIRKSLGFKQKEFSILLGMAEKTFARYENGHATQSKPMDHLLRILKDNPNAIRSISKLPQFTTDTKLLIDFKQVQAQQNQNISIHIDYKHDEQACVGILQ